MVRIWCVNICKANAALYSDLGKRNILRFYFMMSEFHNNIRVISCYVVYLYVRSVCSFAISCKNVISYSKAFCHIICLYMSQRWII